VPATRLTLSLAAPARDPAQLLGLLEARMSRISLVEPVVYLGVRAIKILPLAPDNRDLYEPLSASGGDWKTLLAQLEARLSAESVHAFSVHADYRPERAWKREGFKQKRGEDPFFNPLSPLPLWLLNRPKPLKTVAGAPCWRQPLLLHQGPQRIESGWWDRAPIARDYYVAADSANARFWIFQDLRTPRRWYLHGVFG
jgi:protein ImuB